MSYYKEDIFPDSLSYDFFIFASLGRSHPKTRGHGWHQASDLRKMASGYLNSYKLTPNDSNRSQAFNRMKTALDFLEQAANQEATRESAFFNKLLSNPRLANTPELDKLKACFPGDGTIDYDNFMLLIQQIDRGEKGGKELITSLYNHVKSFNDILQDYLKNPKNQKIKEKYDEIEVDQLVHALFSDDETNIRQNFQRSSNIPTGRVKTLANAIKGSQRAGPDTKELVNFFQSHIKELGSTNYISVPLANSEYGDTYKAQILIELEAIAKTILQNDGNIDPKVSEVSQKAIQLLQTIINKDQKENKKESLEPYLEQFQINAKKLESGKQILKELDQLVTTSNNQIQYNEKTKRLIGFTKERRQQLLHEFENTLNANDKTLKELKQIETHGDFNKSQIRTKYQSLIKSALRKYYMAIYQKKSSGSLSNEKMAQLACNILTKNTKMTISLQSEFGAGLTLNELIKKASANIFTQLIGSKQQKTDLRSLIYIGRGIITIDGEETDIDSILELLSKIYEDNYDESYKERLQTIVKESIKETFGEAREDYYNSNNAYSYEADRYARTKSLEAMTTELEHLLSNANGEYDSRTLKEIMENIFSVEQSVKGYQYYIDDKGFHGGSLGATIYEQVDNICQVASDVGISLDPEWLIFAAFNAGNFLLGADLAPHISAFFSIFASLLMFSSSGDLFTQVKRNAEDFMSHISQSSLRIYNFNGLVVLNSYLLRKTHEALLPAYALLEDQYIPANEVIIHNNVGYDTANSYPSPWPGAEAFSDFSEMHKEDVSISTELLVGFLGLLDKLEAIIQQSPI